MENRIGQYSELLLSNDLFKNVGEERLEAALLFYDASLKEYKKGEYLHVLGEKMTQFGVVLSGCVQALTDDYGGNKMIMANVTKGRSFGESLCYLKIPEPSLYIMANTDAVVLWLSAKNLFYDYDMAGNVSNPNGALDMILRNNFTALLAVRALEMNKRVQILSKLSIRDKILTFLTEVCDVSNPSDNHRLKRVTVPMNREDMAAYLGTNRSALSRELSAMKAEHIIDFRKNEFLII